MAYIISAETEYTTVGALSNDAEPLYQQDLPQHITPTFEPGDYQLVFEAQQTARININTSTGGTLASGVQLQPAIAQSFTLNAADAFFVKTNKAGVNVELKVFKIQTEKKITGLTGRGEIGSFPSPDYDNLQTLNTTTRTTVLTQDYRPFKNYEGDPNQAPQNAFTPFGTQSLGDLNSTLFNFQADSPVEIVTVQASFDSTVNVIFTDNKNKPRLINSRFSVLSTDNVRIIDRVGGADGNVYSAKDWEGKLNQIITSSSIPFVKFEGQGQGTLAGGTYRYFFAYVTQDDNVSDVIAESSIVPVFRGTSLASVHAGGRNEPTSKSNEFSVFNLDRSFPFLRVYFTYDAGEGGIDSVSEVFQINKKFSISNGTCKVTHSDPGTSLQESSQLLNLRKTIFERYKTGCEVKGRVFVGNVGLRSYDVAALAEMSLRIHVEERENTLLLPGSLDTDYPDIKKEIPYKPGTSNLSKTQTLAGGYYNPLNVHDRLSYWDGEAYCFGVEYHFRDGHKTKIFPVKGIDNYDGDAVYTNGFDTLSGENDKGIYRFSGRGASSDASLAKKSVISGQVSAKCKHPHFVYDDTLVADLKQIGVTGIRFMRTARKLDTVGQGLYFDTLIMPSTNSVDRDPPNDWDSATKDDATVKYVPAYNLMIEGTFGGVHGREGSTGQTVRLEAALSPTDIDGQGFERASRQNTRKAFISGDFIVNPVKTAQRFNTENAEIRLINRYIANYSVPIRAQSREHTSDEERAPSTSRQFALITPKSQSGLSISEEAATLPITKSEFSEQGTSTTSAGFSTRCQVVVRHVRLFDTYDQVFSIDQGFNSYVGLVLPESVERTPAHYYPINISDPAYDSFSATDLSTFEQGNVYISSERELVPRYSDLGGGQNVPRRHPERAAYIANLYPNGLRSTDEVTELYTPTSEVYFPITQTMYLDDALAAENQGIQLNTNQLEGAGYTSFTNMSSSQGFSAWGGDCYLSPFFRKIGYNAIDPVPEPGEDIRITEQRAIQTGYGLLFYAQSNYNPAGRYEEIANINEGEKRGFLPYSAGIGDEPRTNVTTDALPILSAYKEQRVPESRAYNTGFHAFSTVRNYTPEDIDLPFVQDTFKTSIFFSDPDQDGAFSNGFRNFGLINFQNYPQTMGELVALRADKQTNHLLAVFEYGVMLIPVNERIAQNSETTGTVYFDDIAVLNDARNSRYVSTNIGSQWRDSVKETENFVYGVDTNTKRIWRLVQGSLEFISDFKVNTHLNKILPAFVGKNAAIGQRDIRSFYEKATQTMHFVFEDIKKPDEPRLLAHLAYNELPTQSWKTFYGYHPVQMFSLNDAVYSFNNKAERQTIHQHYVSDKYSVYYGEREDFIIEFVAGAQSTVQNIYNNLTILSSHQYPYKIEYTTDYGTYTQVIRPESVVAPGNDGFRQEPLNSITNYNATYRNDRLYITISHEQKDTSLLDYINRRIRDKYCKIRIFYNTTEKFVLQQVLTDIERVQH